MINHLLIGFILTKTAKGERNIYKNGKFFMKSILINFKLFFLNKINNNNQRSKNSFKLKEY